MTLRPAATLLALAALTLPAAAAPEGGTIRSGEHGGFSRLVLEIDPRTEWSLETTAGRAIIRFPRRSLNFTTEQIFERIPRTRILDVTVDRASGETAVTVDLGCDCRVSTAFVAARYLALDISDRDGEAPPEPPVLDAEETAAQEGRETVIIASAEDALRREIERAAGQGVVEFSSEPPVLPKNPIVFAAAAPNASPPPPMPRPRPGDNGARVLTPNRFAQAQPIPGAAPMRPVNNSLAALESTGQIHATTVYDRDNSKARAQREQATVSPTCLPDAAFTVSDWTTGDVWSSTLGSLRTRLVGEFDRPDPEVLKTLARFYLGTGFGAETRALLAGFPNAELPERALLLDMAAVVDGGVAAPDGPLALSNPCPGQHALWLALGGQAPVYAGAASFAAADLAFADLSPGMRLRVGPAFIDRLIDARQFAEAQQILDVTARSDVQPTRALLLAEARMEAANGDNIKAIADMATLASGDDEIALEAMMRATRLGVDAAVPLPELLVLDLRGTALQYRHSPVEPELRALLVETLAAQGNLAGAVSEARLGMTDLPDARERFSALAVRVLGQAAPGTAPGLYVETVLESEDLLAAAPPADPARRAVGANLVALGLPTPALRILTPAIEAGDRRARLVAADAQMQLGNADLARMMLADMNGPVSSEIRAESLAASGRYDEAGALLTERGLTDAAAAYAWPGGDWNRVAAGQAVAGQTVPGSRAALAGYMAAQAQGATKPSPDPAKLTDDEAFREPVPDLRRPSLDAARRLLAVAPKVENVMTEVLSSKQ